MRSNHNLFSEHVKIQSKQTNNKSNHNLFSEHAKMQRKQRNWKIQSIYFLNTSIYIPNIEQHERFRSIIAKRRGNRFWAKLENKKTNCSGAACRLRKTRLKNPLRDKKKSGNIVLTLCRQQALRCATKTHYYYFG